MRWTALLLLVVWLPLGALCVFSAPLLRLVGQPLAVADKAGRFATVLTFAAGLPRRGRCCQTKVL